MVTISESTLAKEAALKHRLAEYGAVAVAYSGGVDSSYLADVAHEVLGPRAHMLLADTPSLPRSEFAEATALAQARGWHLAVISTREFTDEAFLKNDRRRCYLCKNELFTRMRQYALDHGVAVLAYGETADDMLDPTRLGMVAAREHQVVSPLQEAGLGKAEIRSLSERRQLPTWSKASFACLSSRFPAGTRLTLDELGKVERAEDLLKGLGFHQYRARHHGDLCRIEVELQDFGKILDPEIRVRILSELRAAGYRYVSLDLAGYRTGSTAAAPVTE